MWSHLECAPQGSFKSTVVTSWTYDLQDSSLLPLGFYEVQKYLGPQGQRREWSSTVMDREAKGVSV